MLPLPDASSPDRPGAHRPRGACTRGAVAAPASARGQGGNVVISQVYAGGQSGSAPLRSDYVELFNRGTTPVTIDGWSVQYAAATGTTWRGTTLTGTIPPGGFYLVREATGPVGTDLPTPDASGQPGLRPGQWPPRARHHGHSPHLWRRSRLRHRPGCRGLRRLRTRGGQRRRERRLPRHRVSSTRCCAPVGAAPIRTRTPPTSPSVSPRPRSSTAPAQPCPAGGGTPVGSHAGGRRGPHPRHPGQQSSLPAAWARP